MKIKISAGFSGVIATGSFQNARPSYTAEIEVEVDDKKFVESVDKYQKTLQEICYRNFKQDEQTHY